jgi:magnesium transporter
MIRIFHKSSHSHTLRTIDDYEPHSWIYAEGPTKDQLNDLAQRFSLDAGLLADALDEDELPRLEVEDGIPYIFTRFVTMRGHTVMTSPMLIALAKDQVITISRNPFPRLEMFTEGKVEFDTANQSMLLIKLLRQVSNTYKSYTNTLSKRIFSLTVKVENVRNEDIIGFVRYENILYDLNTALLRVENIFTSLMSGKIVRMNEDERDYVEDLALETGQIIEITQDNIRSIVNIREAYSTIMTNNLNRVIKLFTSLTVILTIPTLIGTFYGMNVQLPLDDWQHAFPFIVFGTVALCIAAVWYFMKNDWL